MKNKDLVQQVREEIKSNLSNITKANSPHIYKAIFLSNGKVNINGYNAIEGKIIKKIISCQLPISAAIPQLELELDLF